MFVDIVPTFASAVVHMLNMIAEPRLAAFDSVESNDFHQSRHPGRFSLLVQNSVVRKPYRLVADKDSLHFAVLRNCKVAYPPRRRAALELHRFDLGTCYVECVVRVMRIVHESAFKLITCIFIVALVVISFAGTVHDIAIHRSTTTQRGRQKDPEQSEDDQSESIRDSS